MRKIRVITRNILSHSNVEVLGMTSSRLWRGIYHRNTNIWHSAYLVDYHLRFGHPVTPSLPAASGMVAPDLICQPGPLPGIKTHSSPAAFPTTLSLPFVPSLFTFLHRPGWLLFARRPRRHCLDRLTRVSTLAQ